MKTVILFFFGLLVYSCTPEKSKPQQSTSNIQQPISIDDFEVLDDTTFDFSLNQNKPEDQEYKTLFDEAYEIRKSEGLGSWKEYFLYQKTFRKEIEEAKKNGLHQYNLACKQYDIEKIDAPTTEAEVLAILNKIKEYRRLFHTCMGLQLPE